jgi:hypothetical protein
MRSLAQPASPAPAHHATLHLSNHNLSKVGQHGVLLRREAAGAEVKDAKNAQAVAAV